MSSIYYISKSDIVERVKGLKTDKLLLVVDENVLKSYEDFISNLKDLGKEVIVYKAKGTEGLKTLAYLEECLEFFIEKGAHRNCHLIAIGGGVTSDFAGLVASILLRGVSWSVIPTTLLAMVDAAIGGKTAVNSRFGKNLIGSFYQPDNIWIDSSFIETLPPEHIQSGRGEILKYILISSGIYRQAKDARMTFNALISSCAQFKKLLVEKDFKEIGERKILNLGHTFGHAIEKMYPISHGAAVYYGMRFIFELFDEKKNHEVLDEVTSALGWEFGSVPWKGEGIDVEKVMSYVSKDKKVAASGVLEIIRLKGAGTPYIDKIELTKLNELLIKRKANIDAL